MPLRGILLVLLTITLFSLSRSTGLVAGEQYGWVQGHYRGPVPYYIGNPRNIDIAQTQSAAAARANQSCTTQQGEAGPRAYPYGYFGAQYRPYSVSHRNYYNDYSQWSFRRGY